MSLLLLTGLGALYAAAHGVRLGLAWPKGDPGHGAVPSITVLQPILSGDPNLETTLAAGPAQSPNARFVWLVDTDDPKGQHVATRLAATYPNVQIRACRPPQNGENPKTLKLVFGAEDASSDVIAVLDDDTTLPPGGLERLAAAAQAHGGLVTAVPSWGRAPNSAGEALVAGFVDGQGASAYLSMARLGRNRTINGMAYAAHTVALRQLGGFAAMGHAVTDDWAIARLFAGAGRPILQTAVPAFVTVTVPRLADAAGLLRRWTVFAHRYVAANLDAAMIGLVLVPAVLPLAGLAAAMMLSPFLALLWLALLGLRAALHRQLVRAIGGAGAAPLWSIVAAELALPVLSLMAALRPNRIRWRSRRMRLDSNGIHYE